MTDLQLQINKLVGQFVSDLTQLAQEAALQTVKAAFSEGVGLSLSGKHGKRNHSQLDQLQETFRSYVVNNPGQRIEEINRALGTSTKDLQLPIRKLVASGRITTKGSKRVTQYFAKKK